MQSLLRRPSTLVILGTGLLAADQLRRLLGWSDATLIAAVALLAVALRSAWRRGFRSPHRREVEIIVLPLSHTAPPEAGRRIFWFVLFLAALVVVPVAFAIATK